jgi:hypothetical protein
MEGTMKNTHTLIRRSDNKQLSTRYSSNTLLSDDGLLYQELLKINGFIEVPLVFFLDADFNNAYYKLSKQLKSNNPQKQTI